MLEDDLAAIERRAFATAGIGEFLKTVGSLRALLVLDPEKAREILLALRVPEIERVALAAVSEAYGAGAVSAAGTLDKGEARGLKGFDIAKASSASNLAAPIAGLDDAGRTALRKAQLLARSIDDMTAALSPIFAHAVAVERDVVTAVSGAGNAGVTRVADESDLPTVWQAETNACVHCLAYSGQVAKPGKQFPGGLTYGDKVYYPNPLAAPPLHPRCRCTVEVLHDLSYAEALRREADRSVLRGFSLESESMPSRVRAAERLLERGVDAPKSVIAYAQRAVKDGKFPTRGRP